MTSRHGSILRLGERDSMDLGQVGHWLLRLTKLAKRSEVPNAELPRELVPDHSARRAISIIPLSMEQAVTLAHRRNIALMRDDPDIISDQEMRSVRDCELILDALAGIRELILDDELGEEITEWLTLYEEMAPGMR